MKRKKKTKPRLLTCLLLALAAVLLLSLAVQAAGEKGQEQIVYQEVIASYFDVWKGDDWQDTDSDGKPDKPGERKEVSFTYTAPGELLKSYTLTRVEIMEPVDKKLYEEAGGRKYLPDGTPGKMEWPVFDGWYNFFAADIKGASAELTDAAEGKAEVTWDIVLEELAKKEAVNLKNSAVRDFLGLDSGNLWTTMNEGWRWYMPGVLRWYGVPKTAPDLYVADIDPGTEETHPGETYNASVTFGLKDTIDTPAEAKLELTHNGYPVGAVHGKVVTFNPGEEKTFDFTFTGVEGKDSVLTAKILPVDPDTDIDMSNNEMTVTVPAVGAVTGSGEGELILRAVSPEGYDVWGKWQPSVERPVNTAKYGDTITAYFTAPGPPGSLGRCYRLKNWELKSARIKYPKRHPDFTFGWPKDPVGTVVKDMDIDGNKATISFLEDWSLNGAFLFIAPENRMVDGPTYYDVTVDYEMLWEYEKGRRECYTDENWERHCHCVDWKDYSKTLHKSVTVKLLVNGTAIGSYGGGS